MRELPLLGVRMPPPFCQYAAGPCDQPFDHLQESDIFAAYASQPSTIAATLDAAISQLTRSKPNHRWVSWREMNIGGQIIFCEICKGIRFARVFVADVTVLNFNVLFELGYAVGLGKPIRLLRDTSYVRDARELEESGILDTIGYDNYSTSDAVVGVLLTKDPRPIVVSAASPELRSSPIYVVLPALETEGIARVKSALKQSAFQYRAFDAKETPRLSFSDLTRQVSSSVATVLPLLDEARTGAVVHNARCAFVAGLALARGLHVLLVQEGSARHPIDYRDICQSFSNPKQIHAMMERLVKQVATTISSASPAFRAPEQQKDLERLDLGDVAAENEDEQLRNYFVKTAQFHEAARGHARLVVGRKGTGKSAIFSQLRDSYIRRAHDYVVLDLRPEGYQLQKLVELMRSVADAGVREQLSTTLWYFVLLTELARSVLERDVSIAYRTPETLDRFRALERFYEPYDAEDGDFSDRLLTLITRIQDRFPWTAPKVASADVNEDLVWRPRASHCGAWGVPAPQERDLDTGRQSRQELARSRRH